MDARNRDISTTDDRTGYRNTLKGSSRSVLFNKTTIQAIQGQHSVNDIVKHGENGQTIDTITSMKSSKFNQSTQSRRQIELEHSQQSDQTLIPSCCQCFQTRTRLKRDGIDKQSTLTTPTASSSQTVFRVVNKQSTRDGTTISRQQTAANTMTT